MTSGTEKRVRRINFPIRLSAEERAVIDAAAERLGISFDSPSIVFERVPRAEAGQIEGDSVAFASS